MPNQPLQQPNVTPLVEGATRIVEAGAGVIQTVIQQAGTLDPNAPARIEEILAPGGAIRGFMDDLYEHVGDMLTKIKEISMAVPAVPQPPSPISAPSTLKQIAQAIKDAEGIFNEQNLVIVKGTVDAELSVRVPEGGPGAVTRITFEITPKPQG